MFGFMLCNFPINVSKLFASLHNIVIMLLLLISSVEMCIQYYALNLDLQVQSKQ